jgi:hypothetical protein
MKHATTSFPWTRGVSHLITLSAANEQLVQDDDRR